MARHLNTLAMLIAGIVGSQKCHLPTVAKKVLLSEVGEQFTPTDLWLAPGDRIVLQDMGFTAAQYCPVLVCIIWEAHWKEPLVLVSKLDFLAELYAWHKRRFRIEWIEYCVNEGLPLWTQFVLSEGGFKSVG